MNVKMNKWLCEGRMDAGEMMNELINVKWKDECKMNKWIYEGRMDAGERMNELINVKWKD